MKELIDYYQLLKSEIILLCLVVISFIYSISLVCDNNFSNSVHQFNSFQEQVEATITCHGGHIRSIHINETHSSLSNQQSHYQKPYCAIYNSELKLFNDNNFIGSRLEYNHIRHGGKFKPSSCSSRQEVAIVVPYRDRQEQLEKFALYIHQFLPDQSVQYSLYIIEQADELPFNRAKLFNIGFNEITKLDPNICCFIFHDVDLLPLDQRNLYMCTTKPRHLSSGVSTMRYKLLYPSMFGGVIAMTKNQFKEVDGFSNVYFGWGGEDDDMFKRIIQAGNSIDRTPKQTGIYIMMRHSKMKPNPKRFQLLENFGQNFDSSGVSRLGGYQVENITEDHLFTTISVKL